MAKRKKPTGNPIPEWVVTYGDLMSLLLCFFILLAAFSELKQEREYQKVVDAIKESLGFRGGLGVANTDSSVTNSVTSLNEERAKRAGDKRDSNINWDSNVVGREDQVSVIHEGQMAAIGGTLPFEPGDAELSDFHQEMLRSEVAPRIRDQRFIVRVVGHAWGVADVGSGKTLDELAFDRALAVKAFLVQECGVDATILRVESAGATEPVSLDGGGGEAGGGNRRVQVWQTGRTVDQTHPDPNFTGG
ncbi:MAG: flagellar motor protein MotB [Planctomycetota bacterium]